MKEYTNIVETTGRLQSDKKKAWEKICFYEHITIKPSLFLRMALPVPGRTTGCYQNVGDTSRCIYSDGGYLTKKITHIEDGDRIEFDIIEQSIRYHRLVKLRGGIIRVIAHEDGTSSVKMTTRYACRYQPVFPINVMIGFVVKAMHKIVIQDMQYCLAASIGGTNLVAEATR